MPTTNTNSTTASVKSLKLKQGVILIGRADENDLSVKDTQVNAYHAKIVTFFNASYVEDLGSTHGTYLNGQRVKKHTIHPGDVLKLGEQMFRVEQTETEAPS